MAEAPGRKDRALLPLGEISDIARTSGYSAFSMRASQLSVHSSPAEIETARETLAASDLDVSMVTGNVDLAANNNRAQMVLHNITPYLDLADALNCDLVRVMMKSESDFPWARRAADEALERGVKLTHQTHTCTLFETITGSIRSLKSIGRPNFGVTFEPANLMLAGERHGHRAVMDLSPWIFNVYFQNHRVNPKGTHIQETWKRGPVGFDLISLDSPGGVEFPEVLDALSESGYNGYVTVHQNVADGMDIATGVSSFAEYLRTLAHFE